MTVSVFVPQGAFVPIGDHRPSRLLWFVCDILAGNLGGSCFATALANHNEYLIIIVFGVVFTATWSRFAYVSSNQTWQPISQAKDQVDDLEVQVKY